VGAWAYLNYIHPELARRWPLAEKPAATVLGAQAADAGRLDDLGHRLDELQSRVDKLPKASALPDLEPINQKLSVVDDLSRKLDAERSRVGTLPEKIDQNARKITALMADVEGVKNQLSSLHSDVQTAKSTAATASEKAARTAETVAAKPALTADEDFAQGVEQFQQKKFKEASDTFSRLTQSRTDDARVWYFAALARGFATGDWKGPTEQMVNQGLDHERSGQPDKSKIDAAFSGLTSETGKDWLTFYRRKAAGPAERTPR
jgi:hypothetical protein